MRKAQRGNSLIEFALAFTVMAFLFTGIFEWGYTFYVYNNIATNIRAGARYAAQKSFTPSSSSTSSSPVPCAGFIREVRNMVIYGDAAADQGALPIAPGLAPQNIDVTATYDGAGVPVTVRVGISDQNPYNIGAVVARTQLRNKPSVTFPYTGIYSPAAICTP